MHRPDKTILPGGFINGTLIGTLVGFGAFGIAAALLTFEDRVDQVRGLVTSGK